jgi:hypothetical protein
MFPGVRDLSGEDGDWQPSEQWSPHAAPSAAANRKPSSEARSPRLQPHRLRQHPGFPHCGGGVPARSEQRTNVAPASGALRPGVWHLENGTPSRGASPGAGSRPPPDGPWVVRHYGALRPMSTASDPGAPLRKPGSTPQAAWVVLGGESEWHDEGESHAEMHATREGPACGAQQEHARKQPVGCSHAHSPHHPDHQQQHRRGATGGRSHHSSKSPPQAITITATDGCQWLTGVPSSGFHASAGMQGGPADFTPVGHMQVLHVKSRVRNHDPAVPSAAGVHDVSTPAALLQQPASCSTADQPLHSEPAYTQGHLGQTQQARAAASAAQGTSVTNDVVEGVTVTQLGRGLNTAWLPPITSVCSVATPGTPSGERRASQAGHLPRLETPGKGSTDGRKSSTGMHVLHTNQPTIPGTTMLASSLDGTPLMTSHLPSRFADFQTQHCSTAAGTTGAALHPVFVGLGTQSTASKQCAGWSSAATGAGKTWESRARLASPGLVVTAQRCAHARLQPGHHDEPSPP